MPRHSAVLKAPIETYLAVLKSEERAKITIDGYRFILYQAVAAWDAAGLNCNPRRIGKEEIDHLRHEAWAHLDPSNCRKQLSVVGTYLDWHGNPIVKRMKIPWPQNMRINVDWLEEDQAMRLMNSSEGVERMVVHLELGLGMRRCEVLRLRLQDVQDGVVNILGKGKHGGKWRTVPWRPDTQRELKVWLKERERLVREALKKRPDQRVPETLLLYAHKGTKLGSYHDTAMDDIVKRAAKAANISAEDCSNHTLRRTCGRMLYRATVPIAVISRILGHEDVRTTIKYLGLNLDDMTSAWGKLDEYLKKQEQTLTIQTR